MRWTVAVGAALGLATVGVAAARTAPKVEGVAHAFPRPEDIARLDEDKFRSDEKKALEAVQGLGHASKETAASSSGDGKKETAPVVQVPGK